MTPWTMLQVNLGTIGSLLGAMAIVALAEAVIPLHARGRWHRAHLAPNLALTFLTFATNTLYNGAVLLFLAWLGERGFGLLRWASLGPAAASASAVVLLDLSYWVAHVAMHKVPAFWKVHRVHHCDPVVDVTTTIRQHPLEGVIRYAFMAACAGALGAGLGAFAVYRAWSALAGLLEHANLRLPRRLDRALSWVTTSPNMHKVHHSREVRETDSNYGNILSWFDRLFGTYTPSQRGEEVATGLDGFDAPALQTTAALLSLRAPAPPPRPAISAPPASARAAPRSASACSAPTRAAAAASPPAATRPRSHRCARPA
jgi:sterol desaturase/sphingolipid hydroxylase (fatty acid hydroxylase superfamily)